VLWQWQITCTSLQTLHHSSIKRLVLFLMPTQQYQSTEGNRMLICWFFNTRLTPQGCGQLDKAHCSTHCWQGVKQSAVNCSYVHYNCHICSAWSESRHPNWQHNHRESSGEGGKCGREERVERGYTGQSTETAHAKRLHIELLSTFQHVVNHFSPFSAI